MALRKESLDHNEGQASNKTKRSRLTIDMNPELRLRVRMAALKKNLSISEYVSDILEKTVPEEVSITEEDEPITQEDIERLRRIRKKILQARQGKLFENSVEMIRQMREERTQYLEQIREQS